VPYKYIQSIRNGRKKKKAMVEGKIGGRRRLDCRETAELESSHPDEIDRYSRELYTVSEGWCVGCSPFFSFFPFTSLYIFPPLLPLPCFLFCVCFPHATRLISLSLSKKEEEDTTVRTADEAWVTLAATVGLSFFSFLLAFPATKHHEISKSSPALYIMSLFVYIYIYI
jgi:hypothetical protein